MLGDLEGVCTYFTNRAKPLLIHTWKCLLNNEKKQNNYNVTSFFQLRKKKHVLIDLYRQALDAAGRTVSTPMLVSRAIEFIITSRDSYFIAAC